MIIAHQIKPIVLQRFENSFLISIKLEKYVNITFMAGEVNKGNLFLSAHYGGIQSREIFTLGLTRFHTYSSDIYNSSSAIFTLNLKNHLSSAQLAEIVSEISTNL